MEFINTQALRTKILDLAVRGKLVSQDSSDESVSVLLDKIHEVKERLIKENKIKRNKNESVIYKVNEGSYHEKLSDDSIKNINGEIPFEIPDSWEWRRLNQVSNIVMGQSPKSETVYDYEKKESFEFHQGKSYFGDKYINPSTKYTTTNNKVVEINTIIMSVRAPVGDVNLNKTSIALGRGLASINPIATSTSYLYYYLTKIKAIIESKSTGSTFKSINSNILNNLMIAVPPLQEQNRIVERIESLFNEIEKIDEAQKLMKKLQDKIDERVLSLAIRGKLTSQRLTDETASVLLEKVREEKEQLIKEKKIKRNKNESTIYKNDDGQFYEKFSDGSIKNISEEIPFEIPDSWEWTRLSNLFEVTSSKRVHKEEWTSEGIPFYRAREIVSFNKGKDLLDPIYISSETYKQKVTVSGRPEINDLLITGVGTIGVPFVVLKNEDFYFKDGNIVWLKNIFQMNAFYIQKLFKTQEMIKLILRGAKGTTVNTLTINRANLLLVPVPPLNEQERIVKTIENINPK